MSDITADRQVFDRSIADLKSGVAAATETYGNASAKAAKAGADFASFNHGTLEAFAQSYQLFATEAQSLFRQAVEVNRTAMAEGLSSFNAIVGAKSAVERMQLHATFVRTAAIRGVEETARFARAGIDMSERVAAPLMARAYATAGKAGSFNV